FRPFRASGLEFTGKAQGCTLRYGITPFQGFWLGVRCSNEGLYPSVIYSALSGLAVWRELGIRRASPFDVIFRPFGAFVCEWGDNARDSKCIVLPR
ncbi:hypothetical protein, partial [Lentimicrobium sp.]|uniref:hypothetical protein n=1 Tax=Lentimicrobium sp. TaxID=2034841 RepID=UPI00345E357B